MTKTKLNNNTKKTNNNNQRTQKQPNKHKTKHKTNKKINKYKQIVRHEKSITHKFDFGPPGRRDLGPAAEHA